MRKEEILGYTGKLLRVDLTSGSIREEAIPQEVLEQYIGGTGLGAYYLYKEVPPGVEWDSPGNRIILASGPLGGTPVSGSGGFSLVTKGPMTNLAVSTQANGFWGAFLRLAGYDALIIQGKSSGWVYLAIVDGKAQLRDASPIFGKDTWEMEEAIKRDLNTTKRISAFGIGPAGENLVRFAIVAGDKGHIASKNGCGCVMGSKRLKAIAISREAGAIPLADKGLLLQKNEELDKSSKEAGGGLLYKWGTGGGFSLMHDAGILPVRNYTTNVFPEHKQMNGEYIRTHFETRNYPCWACRLGHVKMMKVTEGPYKGEEGEEPEYECLAAWGPVVGNTDPGAVLMLSNLTDKLGMDVNESGWLVAWVMECFEKGILKAADLDGLEMKWGDVEAIRTLLQKIAQREGVGAWLAEGVKRAADKVGGEAVNMGVYSLRGSTPRGHDHRGRWGEMMDTCISATGTVQAGAYLISPALFGMPPIGNSFSPWEVAASNAKMDGWFVFVDSLGICRFITVNPQVTVEAVNAATGRNLTLADVLLIGRRIVNVLRVFNFRHGLDPKLEAPSPRYGSTPMDGPAKGKAIEPYFNWMKSFYFELMGWDPKTGKPLPRTLESLGLEKLIVDLPD
jgi:aldehyde:ferredoxin oxidoreductase